MTDEELLFFDGHLSALPLYEALRERLLAAFPDTVIVVQKTQITFKNRRVFACASLLPAKRKAERPDPYLTVTFGLDHPVYHERIAVTVEARPNRWTHHVLIGSPREIDGELMGWIGEARVLSKGKR